MTPEELLERFRRDVSDPELPSVGDDTESLWSDDEIFDYMDLAQKEFARQTRYFLDRSTALSQVTLVADSPTYSISHRILKIRQAQIGSANPPLQIFSLDQFEGSEAVLLDDYGLNALTSNWQAQKGTPRVLITDWDLNTIRLVPMPTAAATLQLHIYRLPCNDLTSSSSTFELIEREHQLSLLDHMKHSAYLKQDADTFDEKLSASFAQRFFFYTDSVRRELEKKRRPPGRTAYGGIPF